VLEDAMNADRVGKLIRMLSSPNDGEVVAAARALMRTLESEGNDIHDLAARVEGGGRREAKAATANAVPSFYDMACEIERKANGCLSEKDQTFVADMVRWCARREPSEKQAKWLHSIYCRIGRAYA
jgi:citrate synthase